MSRGDPPSGSPARGDKTREDQTPRDQARRGHTRRDFLKKTAGAVPGAAIAGSLGAGACAPDTPDRASGADGGATEAGGTTGATGEGGGRSLSGGFVLPGPPLRAVAETVLPTGALGPAGTQRAVRGFVAWVEAFAPAAELDHPYLTGELRYGSAHPGPRWAAQLEAMELESRRRTGASLADRSEEERTALLEEAIREDDASDLPSDPARADHVAVGLLAWFYGTSEANDLCYGAEIGRHLCRGIETLPEEPGPLEGA